MQTYETERVRLRGWLQADLVPFAAINADPEVTEFLPAAMTRAESDGFVDRIRMQFLERGFGVFAAEEREPGEFMGFVGLNVPSFEAKFTPCVEVGWRLARAHWGKGYATEAAREALRIGFAIHTASPKSFRSRCRRTFARRLSCRSSACDTIPRTTSNIRAYPKVTVFAATSSTA